MWEHGLYILGDSAYALRPFLLTPYDNANHGTPEDVYNYYHSSNRIFVECAFGEIDARWGILWSPLRFSLQYNINVIDATMRLHNYIVMLDIKTKKRKKLDGEFDNELLAYMRANPGNIVGIFGDNHRPTGTGYGGSESQHVQQLKKAGELARNQIRDKLSRLGLNRLRANWYRSETGRIVET